MNAVKGETPRTTDGEEAEECVDGVSEREHNNENGCSACLMETCKLFSVSSSPRLSELIVPALHFDSSPLSPRLLACAVSARTCHLLVGVLLKMHGALRAIPQGRALLLPPRSSFGCCTVFLNRFGRRGSLGMSVNVLL